jgi:hypothetical protein
MGIIKPKKYQLKIFFNDGRMQRTSTKKQRRISYKIQEAKKSEVQIYFIRVTYGVIIDADDKKVIAKNEGEYLNKQNLIHAIKCFCEKGIND